MKTRKLSAGKHPVFASVYDIFDLPYGQIKLFRKALIGYAVNQPSPYYSTIPFGVATDYPLAYKVFNLGFCENHFFLILTLPSPPQFGHFL